MDPTSNGVLWLHDTVSTNECKGCIWFEWDKGADNCVNRHHLCCELFQQEQFNNSTYGFSEPE